MGFFSSIARGFKKILKKAAPIISTVAPFIPQLAPFAGVLAATSAFGGGAERRPRVLGVPTFAQPLSFGGGGTQVASLGAGMTTSAAGLATIGRGMMGLIRSTTGRISGVRLGSGTFISRKKMVALAKRVGIEAAALALGITVVQLAESIATTPTRRRRGISAADIRRTRSTLRKVCVLTNDLKAVTGRKRVC